MNKENKSKKPTMKREAAIKERVMAVRQANRGRECNVRGGELAGKRFSFHCDSHTFHHEEDRSVPEQKYIEFNPTQEWGFSGPLFCKRASLGRSSCQVYNESWSSDHFHRRHGTIPSTE
jgi:hypothetical protein